MKNKKFIGISILIALVIIASAIVVLFSYNKKSVNVAELDAATLRAMEYEQLEDDEMYADNCEYVKFGAFFTKNLDDDEEAERVLGSCNKIGSSDTLYMDLNILSNGYLKDGKITINSTNFTYKMQMVKDSVLKKDYVSNNVKEIELNTVNSGTQKLIMGTIHASISNKDSYTKVNTITLTGTHVTDDGTETPIEKSIDLTIDWYGTASASLSGSSTTYEPTDFSTEENVTVQFSFTMKETTRNLIPAKNVVQATIPTLLDYEPTSVSCNISSAYYSYDEENKILNIENQSPSNECDYIVTVTYPKEAAEALIAQFNEKNLVRITSDITGYYECYNNQNEQFTNPYVTNTASTVASVVVQVKVNTKASHLVDVIIDGKTYISYPVKGYAMSKENLLEAYDSEDAENIRYKVGWSVYRQKTDVDKTTLVLKDSHDQGDLFDNTYIEEYVNNIGLYFGATSLIPDDGTISIYNDETNELIKEFKNEEWKNYTVATPFYYDEGIKDIRIETTEDSLTNNYFIVYNIREIDIQKLKQDYTRTQVEDIAQLKTYMTASGSNIVNKYTVTDTVNFVIAKSYNKISIDPTYIATSEIDPIDSTIRISVPQASISYAAWQNGVFLVEMPSKIIYMNLEDVSISSDKVTIDGYELYKENNKYYIKIVTSNENPASNFSITVKSKILSDPMSGTIYEQINLYSYNENCKMYYNSTYDTLDINGNENKSEIVRKTSIGFQITAPSSFVTVETVSNYNDAGEITVAPNIAEVTRGTREATINVEFANNYEDTVSNIELLGKIPYEGNTYVNGNSLNSEFTATMTDSGITVPDGLKNVAKVYYSEKDDPTKDLEDLANGWTLAENVTSFENIKTYLIVVDNYNLVRGRKYSFSYTVTIPQDVTFNSASYSCHTVYFKINTAGGALESSVQPNKVGIRIVRYYDFEIMKYKEGTTLGVSGAKYSISEEDEEGNEANTRILTSSLEGKLYLSDLKVNQVYIFKEIQAPNNYELNTEVIKFKVTENSNQELEFVQISDESFDGEITFEKDANGKDVMVSSVLEWPKMSLNITKIDKDSNEPIQGITFELDGKSYITNSNGKIVIENLSLGKQYSLKETYANGYYFNEEPITFSVNRNTNNELVMTSNNELFRNATITNDDTTPLIQVDATIVNEKIPTYNLQIIKVDENNEELKLKGARFLLEREDLGNSIYYTTDENGCIDISNLYQFVAGKSITGRYILKEVESPNGYINNQEEIAFIVTKNSEDKLQMNIENKDSLETVRNIEIDGENVKLTIQDKSMFKILKVDAETQDPLANAEFIIYELNEDGTILDFAKDVNGNYIGTVNEDGNYVVVSDANGIITAAIGNGSYKLIESKAPEGYEKNSNVEVFTITGNKLIEEEEEETEKPQEKTVIEIDSIEDLVELSDSVNSGNTYQGTVIKLTRTLDFNEDSSYESEDPSSLKTELTSGTGFTPIGVYDNSDYTNRHYFAGEFDGQGFEIRNIYINANLNYAGLFGYVDGAKIVNLGLTGNITSNTSGNTYVGGFVGYTGWNNANTQISDCYNKADISARGSSAHAGGISGYSYVKISHCYNEGNVEAIAGSYTSYALGIGNAQSIYNCYNTGNITSNGTKGASAYGIGNSNSINCYNIGNIEAQSVDNSSTAGVTSTSNSNIYCLDTAILTATTILENHTKLTSSYMKLEDFVNDLDNRFWKLDTENKNQGYPVFKDKNSREYITEINCIEDLVKLSNDVNKGIDYEGVTITLKETLNFNDENSYNKYDDESFGDLNGDGNTTGIKDELTNTEGAGFVPIGNYSNYFSGTFDGQGNEIQNLYVKRDNWVGLFGHINSGKVINLGVTGVVKGKYEVGGICGYITKSAHIENCYNKCEVTTVKNDNGTGDYTGNYYGGIVGYCTDIENLSVISCKNYGNIHAYDDIGGIIGSCYEGYGNIVISNCINYGYITSENDAGGILGYTSGENLKIEECTNEASVVGGYSVGGIVGNCYGSNLDLKSCNNIGDIQSKGYYLGGIIGYGYSGSGKIQNCYNTGNIIFDDPNSYGYVGGIVGRCEKLSIIENSYNSGNIQILSCPEYSETRVGGIIGYAYYEVTVKSCYNTGTISSFSNTNSGGIVGYAGNEIIIYDCYNTGNININSNKLEGSKHYYVGGIIGCSYEENGSIAYSYNTGDITIISKNSGYAGGISGQFNSNVAYTYNTGNIDININSDYRQYTYIGGISAYLRDSSVSYSYNTGNITTIQIANSDEGYLNVSGIAMTENEISNCYNEGNIDVISNIDDVYIGGIKSSGNGSIVYCYNMGNIKNKMNPSIEFNAYIGGILGYSSSLSGDSIAHCYNQGEINNFVEDNCTSLYNYSYVGGIVGSKYNGSVSCTYNSGSIYNNVTNSENEYLGTGAIYGYMNTVSGGNNYYLSSIDIIGENITQTATASVTDEYMKTEEFYKRLSGGNPSWKYLSNSYPILDIPVLTKTEKTITEITVENTKENYEITTEIKQDENGEYTGGTISGNYTDKYMSMYYKKLLETVVYGEDSTKEIVITPKTGYQIAKVTINDVEYAFETNEEGIATIPAGYFIDVDKNYNVAVTFSLKENTLTINKVNEQGDPLEGAVFEIHQIDNRPAVSDEVKDFVSDSTEYNYEDKTKPANDLVGELINNGTYYFEKQTNGTYISNNKGVASSTAESYAKIDLTGKTGDYYIVVNATASSHTYDYGIAAITSDTTAITIDTTNFIKYCNIQSGTAKQKLTGGQVYYLHFAYIKDAATDYRNDIFTINSINLYEAKSNKFEFEESNGKYVSTYNESIPVVTYATGYIPIDLTNTTGKYNLTVSASLSGNTQQQGYIMVTETPNRVISSSNYLIYLSGGTSKVNSIVLTAGKMYYLHISHYNYSLNLPTLNNVLTINNIGLSLNTDDFYHETDITTNSKGQIIRGLKYGKYAIVETEAPEGYTLKTEATIHEIGDGTNNNVTIVNESKKSVTTHYYINGTNRQIIADDVQYGNKGDEYTTTPYITLDGYTLIQENGEYVIPENASGYIGDENIDVYYYYEEITYGYTINYYYDGILYSDETITGKAKPGEIISTYEDKVKEGYGLDRTENLPLTISTFEDENIINIYYTTVLSITTDVIEHTENYTDGTVIENQKGGTISGEDQKPYEQIEIGSSNTSEIKVDPNDGYQIVKILINEEPFDFSGKLTEDGDVIFEPGYFNKMQESKHIEVEFRKSSNVIVKHLEKDTEKVLYKTDDGKEYEEIIGYESQSFTTERKTIDGYIPATPGITNDAKVEIEPNGTIYADTLTVIYWYQAEEATIIERFFEVFENGNTQEMESHTNTGKTGEDFSSVRRTYELYDSADAPTNTGNSNIYVVGKNEDSKTITYDSNVTKEIWYYYTKKKANITVIYKDNITGKELQDSPDIVTQEVGTPYHIVRKEFSGYRLDENRIPTNENGIVTIEGDTVTYYYIELKEYELEVVYKVDSDPVNDVKIRVENESGLVIDDYITNGKLSVDKIESTDIGISEYRVYESETPEVYKQILTPEKPGEIKIVKTFDEKERRYKVTAECNDIEELDVVVDDVNNKITIYIDTMSKYNLSIKKFISAIDDTIIEDRAPVVTLNSEGKPEYSMNENIEKISNSQNVTYTLRMYNESNITAKGKRIIEYIPDGLVFLPENEKNISYGWKLFGINEDGDLYETNNVDEAKVVVTDYLVDKEIEAFNGEELPHYLDVEVVFEVDETKLTSEDRIIENKVQIMPNDNDDYPDNDQSTEKLYVKYFDLSIEKYIEEVTVVKYGGEETYKYGYDQKDTLVKIDLKKSQVDGTVIKVKYGLVIKNVGEIPGYATEIIDYTPESFVLLEDKNWSEMGDVAKSTALADVILEPGESTILTVDYEWRLSEKNIGARVNEAAITAYTNDYDAIDLTGDNKDKESMIITVKTGFEMDWNKFMTLVIISLIGALGVVIVKERKNKNVKNTTESKD